MATPADLDLSIVTRDAASTHDLGAALAAAARAGDLVCLWGDLGAGKTVFAKGFASGLGVTATVNSPSFVLMAEYRGRLPLFHIDLYRLESAEDALSGGLVDERQSEGVTLIEWPDRLGRALPADRLDIRIDGAGDDPRTIAIVAGDSSLSRYLGAVPR